MGDKNAAQAGIIASNKTHIGTLDLWQSAGLNIIAPPEGGYKDKHKDKPSNTTQNNANNNQQNSTQNNSNTQVINPPNSAQKTEIQPTQVIDGLLPVAKTRLSISTASTLTLMARLEWEGIKLLLPPMRLICISAKAVSICPIKRAGALF